MFCSNYKQNVHVLHRREDCMEAYFHHIRKKNHALANFNYDVKVKIMRLKDVLVLILILSHYSD